MSKLISILRQHQFSSVHLTEVGGKTSDVNSVFVRADQLKNYFDQQGFQQSQRCLLLFKPGIEFVATVIALIELGVTVILVDPGVGPEVFKSQLKASNPDWVICDPRLFFLIYHPIARWLVKMIDPTVPVIPFSLASKCVLTHFSWLSPWKKTLPAIHSHFNKVKPSKLIADDCPAVVVFTSGTTAEPKAVVHTHGSLGQSLALLSALLPVKHDVLYTNQVYFMLVGVALGAPVVFNGRLFSASQFLNDSERYQPTLSFNPPGEITAVLHHLERQRQNFPECYRHLLLGSAPATKGFLKKLTQVVSDRVQITCLYGMTEVLPIASVDGRAKLKRKVNGDLLGKLAPGIKARVTKDGELLVKAKHQADHYLGKSKLKEVATGDVVTLTDKEVILKARKKDMILRKSFNIYPSLYEPLIESVPGVVAACLVGVYDHQREDEVVFLVVEKTAYSTLSETSLLKALQTGTYRIDEQAWPDVIMFMKIPRAGRQQKSDKTALRNLCQKILQKR